MDKTMKTPLIFLLIVIQSLIAMTAGIAVLFDSSQREVPVNVHAGGLNIGGKSYSEAVKAIEAEYDARFRTQRLRLKAGGDEIYEIPYSSIAASVDGEAMLSSLRSIKGISDIPRIMDTYFGHYGTELVPVVDINESRLKTELLKLSEEINTVPEDAEIFYCDGIIEKKADDPGISLDVILAEELILSQLSSDPFGIVDLSSGNVLKTVSANVTMKDYEEIQLVLGQYSTSIKDGRSNDSIQHAVDSINGIMIPEAGEDGTLYEFSFSECLGISDVDSEDDGYDQVASTLYAALITAGLPKDRIVRFQHELPVDYIEIGLDSWVGGSAVDLRFTNPFDNPLTVFAVREGSVVTVAIAGNREDKDEKCVIRKEIVQELPPPVYYIENKDLKPGEKVVLDPGKSGVTVNVYRNDELISTDQYEAESSIVQIAPVMEMENENK